MTIANYVKTPELKKIKIGSWQVQVRERVSAPCRESGLQVLLCGGLEGEGLLSFDSRVYCFLCICRWTKQGYRAGELDVGGHGCCRGQVQHIPWPPESKLPLCLCHLLSDGSHRESYSGILHSGIPPARILRFTPQIFIMCPLYACVCFLMLRIQQRTRQRLLTLPAIASLVKYEITLFLHQNLLFRSKMVFKLYFFFRLLLFCFFFPLKALKVKNLQKQEFKYLLYGALQFNGSTGLTAFPIPLMSEVLYFSKTTIK